MQQHFLGGVGLANGKNLDNATNPADLYWFFKTGGASIVAPKSKGGGKSKGARTKGRKAVVRTRDLRE